MINTTDAAKFAATTLAIYLATNTVQKMNRTRKARKSNLKNVTITAL